MKFTLSLIFLGLIVLSCRKETRVDTTTTSDSVIMDTMPSDTAAVSTPIPSDTLNRTDSASVRQMDTVKTKRK